MIDGSCSNLMIQSFHDKVHVTKFHIMMNIHIGLTNKLGEFLVTPAHVSQMPIDSMGMIKQ